MINLEHVASLEAGDYRGRLVVYVTYSQRDVLFPVEICECRSVAQARLIVDEVAKARAKNTNVFDVRPLLKKEI